MAIALHQLPPRHRSQRHSSHLRLVSPTESPAVAARHLRPVGRLTYLRRRLLVVLGLMAIVMGVVFASRAVASEESMARPAGERYVIAQEGDNLWSIAERIAPSSNIPDVVDQLAALNGTSLRVGQVVLIP